MIHQNRLDADYTSGSVTHALCNQSQRFVERLKTNAKLDARLIQPKFRFQKGFHASDSNGP